MSGATARLPDLRPALDAAANAQQGLSQFMRTAANLAGGGPDSPLQAVTLAFTGLQGALDIDVSGLSQRLPQAITTIQNALPSDSLRYVESLQHSYADLGEFLRNNPLVQQVQAGTNLQTTALALIEGVLAQFSSQLTTLGSSLIDADTLAEVTQALATLEQLASGQLPPAGELLPFLSQNLLGVPADLLTGAHSHLAGALVLSTPFGAAALEGRIGAPRDAAAAAFAAVAIAVRDFDAANPAAYVALEGLLQAWATALETGFAAIEAGCGALTTVVAAPAWDSLFSAYAAVLAAVPLQDVPTVDDAVDAMASVLESLLSRLRMSLSPQDLAAQVARVSTAVHDLFAQSGLAQVRQILIDFIARIQTALEDIPTDEVRQAVTGMLQRVQQALAQLQLDQVRSSIAAGFQAAQDFIDQRIGDQLLGTVSQTLASALAQFQRVPIADLGQALTDLVQQAGALIDQLATQLASALDELKNLLAQLDTVDFKPVADEVVTEIDALTAKLAAIRPESLGDVEKVALQAGLAILRAIDLETLVESQLKNGYAAIDDELTAAVQAVLDAWLEFRGRIGGFDGAGLAAPINALLDDVDKAVKGVNGTLVLAPLEKVLGELLAQADSLSPAALLDPLKQPYQQMMSTINRANPDVWVQPLRALHAEIDELVTLIDITPLLDALEAKERELFSQARDSLAAALATVQLPAPLQPFFDTMKALLLGLTDAVFGDPDGSLRQFSLSLSQQVRPSTLFQPLDAAFDRLLAAVAGLPQADVLAVMEALRSGLGTALPALNPAGVVAALRQAQHRLELLSPSALPGVVALPGLRAQLDARMALSVGNDAAKLSLRARFDLVLMPLQLDVPSARLQRLQAAHAALATALRLRINGLDASDALAAYARLDAGLSRLLPPFLRQPQPLAWADVQAGLACLRPSTKARRIDLAVDRFLADLAPLQTALDGSVNGFFGEIRNAALVLHPGALKASVAGVYTSLRTKLQVLDPDVLANDLRTAVWDPLTDPLRAIDPAAIQVQLDALFRQLVAKLGSAARGLLNQLKAAIDGFLGQVRAALAQVLAALKAQIEAILARLSAILATLDGLIVDDLFKRLLHLLDNLQTSFEQQLDRVRNEFDEMLAAIPLGESSVAVAA